MENLFELGGECPEILWFFLQNFLKTFQFQFKNKNR